MWCRFQWKFQSSAGYDLLRTVSVSTKVDDDVVGNHIWRGIRCFHLTCASDFKMDGCWMVLEVILLVTIGYQSNTIWICLVMITHDNTIAMIT